MFTSAGPNTGLSRYRLTVVKFEKKLKENIVQILLPLTVVKHFEFGANQRFRTENGSKIEQ